MRIFGAPLLVITLLIAAACTTPVSTYHNACIEGNLAFADEVACIKANVRESGLRRDTLVQEYLMTSDILLQQVQRGEITEDQARLQLTRKLNEIRKTQAEIEAAQAYRDRVSFGWGSGGWGYGVGWGHPYHDFYGCRYDPFHPLCWP